MKYIKMVFATAIYGLGIGMFFEPNQVPPGGVTGIAVILEEILGMNSGILYFLLNIPIVILGGIFFGRYFVRSTVACVLLISFWTNIFSYIPPVTKDLLLTALFGGCICALGMGLLLKNGGTTGGTDILIKIVRRKYKYIKPGRFHLMIDAFVIMLSIVVYKRFEAALYATLGTFVLSYVLDIVLYGSDEAKMIIVISDYPERICKRVLEELEIGCTYLKGEGAYLQEEKRVLLCIMKKQTSPDFIEIVKQEDEEAFLIVGRVGEIYGNGYKTYNGELGEQL